MLIEHRKACISIHITIAEAEMLEDSLAVAGGEWTIGLEKQLHEAIHEAMGKTLNSVNSEEDDAS